MNKTKAGNTEGGKKRTNEKREHKGEKEVSGVSDVPPVKAGLELSAGVQTAAVQRHDAFTLQLWERLSPVFQLTRY